MQKLPHNILLLFLILLGLGAQAQDVHLLSGQVVRKDSLTGVPFVNIVNMTTSKGVAADFEGVFSMQLHIGDTIVFTAIGYADIRWVAVGPFDKKKEFRMKVLSYAIDQIDVFGFNYEPFDVKKPRGAIRGISVGGLPGSRSASRPVKPNLMSPISLLYSEFSRVERTRRAGWEFVSKMEQLKHLDSLFKDPQLVRLLKLQPTELEMFKRFMVNNLSGIPSIEDYSSLIYLRRAALEFKIKALRKD